MWVDWLRTVTWRSNCEVPSARPPPAPPAAPALPADPVWPAAPVPPPRLGDVPAAPPLLAPPGAPAPPANVPAPAPLPAPPALDDPPLPAALAPALPELEPACPPAFPAFAPAWPATPRAAGDHAGKTARAGASRVRASHTTRGGASGAAPARATRAVLVVRCVGTAGGDERSRERNGKQPGLHVHSGREDGTSSPKRLALRDAKGQQLRPAPGAAPEAVGGAASIRVRPRRPEIVYTNGDEEMLP